MRCERVSELLTSSTDGIRLGDRDAERHVEVCLRCQAELVQYRKLLRALRALRTDTVDAPGLVADVLASLEEAGDRQAARARLAGRSAAYVSGLAVATAAAGAGAFVLAARGKGRRVRIAG